MMDSLTWRDLLADKIIKLERASREDEHAFYRGAREVGANKALSLCRLRVLSSGCAGSRLGDRRCDALRLANWYWLISRAI
jgi:hypothetical protein